ncbi:GPO family capsid scaffolding protein [Spartinivicinus ruber]|uniref:GPO family capsid scaffolding protein n=1 Tax=Spartinivicinus ruber TaxID=2683272 RepID=UPI0013D81190|nr:GPO family capsid scaffolding protein [Spartinivicinus ruber]
MKSGPTIDGREIEPQAIMDMAASYNPAEYTAMIWYEHFRFYGNFGQVVELKTETDDQDRQCLFAKIKPNQKLYTLNEQQQQLFFSGEILPDFRKTGKAYLFGLAITDQPASVGTSQLHFSHRRQASESYFSQPLQFSYEDIAEPESWFSRVFNRDKSVQEQGKPMDEKQFTQLMDSQQKNADAIKQLTETLATFNAASPAQQEASTAETSSTTEKPADNPANNTEEETDKNTSGVSAEEFNCLKQSFEKLQGVIKQLSVEGTVVPLGAGPADDYEEVL